MDLSSSFATRPVFTKRAALCLVVALSCLRLAHTHLLWSDEDYHLAAAINVLNGKIPYLDFWYDKPPLSALYYLVIGGHAGWPVRILDSLYVLLACGTVYRLAKHWWGETEGLLAACFLAFFLSFYLPSAVIPFAVDAVMLVPHLLALYCAASRRFVWAGVWSGLAFVANIKGLLVFAVAILWCLPEMVFLGVGFLLPVGISFLLLFLSGAWPGYVEQVWRWGLVYAAHSPVLHPLANGVQRTASWAGFHAALLVPAVSSLPHLSKSIRWKLGVWVVLSYFAVSLGGRFEPRYFLQLLPPLVLLAARGVALALERRRRWLIAACGLALLVPFVRFGPRYVTLAADNFRGVQPRWSDVAMDLDSQDAAKRINATAKPGDTLFVWGYRPDIVVHTRLVSDSRFWDSQPLTGVAADRHLSATSAIYSGPAIQNRLELARSRPTWVVDGLGLLNPRLAPAQYPELTDWLSRYAIVGRTKLSVIYHRVD